MMKRFLLCFVAVLAVPPCAIAQDASPAAPAATSAKAKPTSEEKRCTASRRRVDRQNEVIAEANARIEREKAARAACKGKRACDSLDRALAAAQTRSQRFAKQLAQFESEASKACAAAAKGPSAG